MDIKPGTLCKFTARQHIEGEEHPLVTVADPQDRTVDTDTGPMVVVEFPSGRTARVFADELTPVPSVWVGVVEPGEEYSDRYPAVVAATTEAAVREATAAAVWEFLTAIAEPDPGTAEFMAEHGDPAGKDTDTWIHAMQLDYDVPAFLTFKHAPIVGA